MNIELYNSLKNKIPANSRFFNDLYDLMNNHIFRQFYDKYFSNWVDIDTNLMYFKTFETLEYIFYSKYNRKLKKNEILFFLNKIFKNKITRKIAINKFNLYKNTCDRYFNFNNLIDK